MSLVLRSDIGRRLTIQEMDGNFTYLEGLAQGGSITELTVAEALDLVTNSGVKAGFSYLITDAHRGLYGASSSFTNGQIGTNIILRGLDDTHFSSNGYGKFYNPIYASYSMWNSSATYSIGDKAIFGGQVWTNTTGNTGNSLGDGYDSSSFISLDPEDWSVQVYTDNTLYNCVWDEVEYSLSDDFIISRYESANNNYVNNASRTFWFYCEINPIQSFRWGSFNEYGPTVTNCSVIDSYFGCLNMINGNIDTVELTSFSWIYNISLTGYSWLYSIKVGNNSGINTFTLDNSSLRNIILENNSTMYDFGINSSGYMEYINISNFSSIHGFNLDGGYIRKVTLEDDSSIYYFTLWDSNFMEWINLSFGSIYGFNLYTGSYIEEINITNDCEISNFDLYNNSYFSCITLEGDSYMESITLYQSSYFENISIKHDSSVRGVMLCDDSGSDCYISNIEITNNSHLWDSDDTIYLNNGGYMDSIKIDNNSEITDIVMYGDSYVPYMQNIIVSNGSVIDNIYFNAYDYQSYIDKLTIIGSGFESIQLNDSYMDYINVSNGLIDNLYLSSNSYIQYIEVLNGAISSSNWITENSDSIYLNNSHMSVVTINQSILSGYLSLESSYLTNVHLSNYSTIVGGYRYYGDAVNNFGEYNYSIILGNSGLDTITLENSSMFGLGSFGLTNSSYVSNISLDNESKLSGYISLDNSSINNLSLNNGSKFGRGNSNSGGNSDTIELYGESSISDITMTNGSVIDGYIFMQNGQISDVVLSGTSDSNDDISNILPNLPGYINNYNFNNDTNIVFGGGVEIYDSYLQDIEISNGSYMTGLYGNEIYLENNSYIKCVKIYNGSMMNDVYLNNSLMKNINVFNGSYVFNLDLESNSSISYLSVSNYSFFGDYIYLSNESYMAFIKVDGNSEIFGGDYGAYDINLYHRSRMENINVLNFSNLSGLIFDDGGSGSSYLKNISIENNSNIYDLQLYNASYLDMVDISNKSSIYGVRLCDDIGSESSLINIKLSNDSHIANDDDLLYIEDGSYIRDVVINNYSYFSGYFEMYGGSSINNLKIENNSWFGYGLYLSNGSSMNNISIDNDSYIEGYVSVNNSSFDYINLKNSSYVTGYSEFYNSYLYNIDLLNYSKIYDGMMTDSAIGQLTMNNNSKMYANTMNGYSAIEYVVANNHSYIHDNSIDNSVFEHITLDNYSNLNDNILENNSNISYIDSMDSSIFNNYVLSNSNINNSRLDDSALYNMSMTSSYISDTQMSDSEINDISMDSSYISDNLFKDSTMNRFGMTSSGVTDNQLYDSSMDHASLSGSYIQDMMLKSSDVNWTTLSNGNMRNLEIFDSYINNIYISNTGIYQSSLKSSNMTNINLDTYSIEFLYMRDSNFTNYNTHTNGVTNLDMIGTTLDFNNNNEYIIPNYTNVNTNFIKYQFSFMFNGTTGYGEAGGLLIPMMLFPSGWYIERVIIDNRGTGQALVASGPGVYLNLGNNVDSDTGLDNTKGDVSLLSSKITYSDISNGGADGTKTNSVGSLNMNVEGGNITSGIILVEVILKSTNYGTNND